MRKTKSHKLNKGQVLFEVVMALAIFSVAVAAVVYLFFGAHYSVLFGVENFQAIMLAKEGIEAVRSIRDANFANITTTTDAGIVLIDNKWTLQSSPDTIGKFTRKINISQVATGTWQVKSTVNWISATGRESEVFLLEYLTDWR